MTPYRWRTLTPEERSELLYERLEKQRSWHAPTHFHRDRWFHVTAACYEHRHHIGRNQNRMLDFSSKLLNVFKPPWGAYRGWCVLPNHYHVLAEVWVPDQIRKALGQFHGRQSHHWNVEEGKAGRKVFHGFLFKEIRSPSHWWSTLNYIHHNPVKHGYVKTWQEWPFSSAESFLNSVPTPTAKAIWKAYPVTGMGKNWDDDEVGVERGEG